LFLIEIVTDYLLRPPEDDFPDFPLVEEDLLLDDFLLPVEELMLVPLFERSSPEERFAEFDFEFAI
jgi:hypothetical protein